ncbi:MAG: hypothetical protein FWG98_15220 [Candidatus Cloacimonetes bacterium]|nr:hypothetical protein [Candidatus Cloacimonadota bacterium]
MKHRRVKRGEFLIKWSSLYEKWQVCIEAKCIEEFTNIDNAIEFAEQNRNLKNELQHNKLPRHSK